MQALNCESVADTQPDQLNCVARPADHPGRPNCQPSEVGALALHGDPFAVVACSVPSVVFNIPAYLKTRRPILHPNDERPLFNTLPDVIRDEVEALLGDRPGSGAFDLVQTFVKAGFSVTKACSKSCLRGALKTFRAKYDAWKKSKDWLTLVNRSKAGAAWQQRDDGLPDDFIDKVCAPSFGRFRRADAKRQAIFAIHRWWRVGRDLHGEARPIPGYESVWAGRNPELLPSGWHYSNILRQIKARAKFTKVVRALLHESTAAAKDYLPQIHGTRNGPTCPLRFLELVTFDDVRTDFLVFDPETGQACELWLLVARDQATSMVLGFVMHLRKERDDGTASSLGLQEMKQLTGFILERYPLPVDYLCTWKVERGTATLSEGCKLALQEMLPNRIKISYTSMLGGKSPAGYTEKAKGNSKGKASHESHNRLFHTQGAYLPGQTGAHYGIRPADLNARVKECAEIWAMREKLPPHLRGQEQYSLLIPGQARAAITRFCLDQNFRTDHKLEGFERVLEFLGPDGRWRPQSEYTGSAGILPAPRFRTRMERPVERALHLIAGHKFESVSPDIIRAFYQHTERSVPIKESGEIEFTVEGRLIRFSAPAGFPIENRKSKIENRALAYYHPDDPKYLHVTNGKGSFLGTWTRRNAATDEASLTEAFRYTATALKAVRQYAEQLAAPERAQLDAIRAHNATLEKSTTDFIEITEPPVAQPSLLNSPVAAALTAVGEQRTETKTQRARHAKAAADDLLAVSSVQSVQSDSAADDLLSALSAPEP